MRDRAFLILGMCMPLFVAIVTLGIKIVQHHIEQVGKKD